MIAFLLYKTRPCKLVRMLLLFNTEEELVPRIRRTSCCQLIPTVRWRQGAAKVG